MNKSKAFIGLSILPFLIGHFPESSTGTVATTQETASALLPSGQEELLGEISPTFRFNDPEYYHLLSVASPDRKQVVWAESKGAKPWTIYSGGKPLGSKFIGGTPPEVYFSEDSQHLFVKDGYRSRYLEGLPAAVLLDGKDQGTEYGGLCDAALSPDGKKFACVSQKGILLVNGQKIAGPFEDLDGDPSLLFSADSNHLGCIVRQKKGKKQYLVISDGQERIIDDPTIDSLDFATSGPLELVANRGDKLWSYIINGKEGPAFNVLCRLVFSSDRKHYAYFGINGKVSAFSGQGKGTVTLVNDGKELEYPLTISGHSSEMIYGYNTFHEISDPVFSEDGLHMAYHDGKGDIIRDGQQGTPLTGVKLDELAYSPDGKHLAGVGRGAAGKIVEVMDGAITCELDIKAGFTSANTLSWSRDSQQTAFIAGTFYYVGDRYWAVVNGKLGNMYKCHGMSKPIFSPNGKHVACIVHDTIRGKLMAQQHKTIVIVDGIEGKPYDEVVKAGRIEGNPSDSYDVSEQGLLFQDDETLVYVAREGRKFYRVTQRLS